MFSFLVEIVGRSYSWNLLSISYFLKRMNLLQAFSIFCGLGIHNTLMYSEVEKAMARQKVAIEVSAKKGRDFRENLIVLQL
jgi:dual 3',5'-cyclic-AMP and -GMP phosphodiesterase 11